MKEAIILGDGAFVPNQQVGELAFVTTADKAIATATRTGVDTLIDEWRQDVEGYKENNPHLVAILEEVAKHTDDFSQPWTGTLKGGTVGMYMAPYTKPQVYAYHQVFIPMGFIVGLGVLYGKQPEDYELGVTVFGGFHTAGNLAAHDLQLQFTPKQGEIFSSE